MGPIAVIIPTYNRSEILRQTIHLLDRYVLYEHGLTFYIGCDGDDDTPNMLDSLSLDIHVERKPSGSFGSNINRLIINAVGNGHDLFLQMDDDHHLRGPLDLNEHARYLTDFDPAGWIRLMGVSYHHFDAHLEGRYWYIRWDSPELYITSMRPHLKHVRFLNHYGMYPEGLKLGETEEGFCHQCKDLCDNSSPRVLIPLDVATESLWDHVGHSWQREGR